MEKVAEILRRYMTIRNLPAGILECAEKLGIHHENFRKTLNEGHIPRDNTLLLYAKQLQFSKKDTRRLLLAAYYQRAPREAKYFLGNLQDDVGNESGPTTSISLIPVLGRPNAKITSEDLSQRIILDHIKIPDVPEGICAIISHGNSMAPVIRDGDYVIFTWYEKKKPTSGDIVLVDTGFDEILIKRYRKNKDGREFLFNENPEYSSVGIEVTKDHHIQGKVIDILRRKKPW